MFKKLEKNPKKFSFAELTSNEDGKTSGSGTMGIIICAIGALTFLLGVLDKMFVSKDSDIITQTIVFTTIGASLLGIRKYTSGILVNAGTQEMQQPNYYQNIPPNYQYVNPYSNSGYSQDCSKCNQNGPVKY